MEGALLTLILGGLFGLFCLGFVVTPWTYMVGARIVGLEKKGFGKAFVAFIVSFVALLVIGTVLNFIPIIGGLLSLVAAFVVPAIALQVVFDTSFGKGLIIEIISFVISSIIVGVLLGVLLIFGFSFAAFTDAWQSVTQSF